MWPISTVDDDGGEINGVIFITAMYFLFLGRYPDGSGIKSILNSLKNDETLYCDIVKNFSICKERVKLVFGNPTYFGKKPTCSLKSIIKFALQKNIKFIEIIEYEYLISENQAARAIKMFKERDEYNNYIESIRMLRLACLYNYIDYAWILGRMYSNFKNYNYVIELGSRIYRWDPRNKFIKSYTELTLQINNHQIADQLVYNLLIKPKNVSVHAAKEAMLLSNSIRKLPLRLCCKCDDIIGAIYADGRCSRDEQKLPINIFVAGFQFSGCSAVSDWLCASKLCKYIDQKFYPFKSFKEFIPLYEHLYNIYYDFYQDEQVRHHKILQLFLCDLLAFMPVTSRDTFIAKLYQVFHSCFCDTENNYLAYLQSIYKFVCNLNCDFHNDKELTQLMATNSQLFNDIYSIHRQAPTKYILHSNAITAWCIKKLEMFPIGGIFIPVIRDPRDIYVSLYQSEAWDVEKFIKIYRDRFKIAQHYARELCDDYKIIPIAYERFVLEPDYRNHIADILKIECDLQSEYFNPAFSRTRIGKFEQFLDQNAIEKIRTEFSDIISGEYIQKYPSQY